MRITSTLLAGSLFGFFLSVAAINQASAQVPEPTPNHGAYARRPQVYPNVHHSQYAYRKAVRYGLAPVLPPFITRFQEGHGLYGAPYYAYPRPPLGHQGYAGFSGSDPNDYLAVIPPPIPPVMPTAPMPPEPTAAKTTGEEIPMPPSDPAPKSEKKSEKK
jgi:hypothetical protein